jgi:hypothetical protein
MRTRRCIATASRGDVLVAARIESAMARWGGAHAREEAKEVCRAIWTVRAFCALPVHCRRAPFNATEIKARFCKRRVANAQRAAPGAGG